MEDMTTGKYFACLLLMLLVTPECYSKHHSSKHTEKPVNKMQPTMYATSPPLSMPVYEQDAGPALISAEKMANYPFYQTTIRRFPKLFLDSMTQTNLPQYVARGMQLDNNVNKIVTNTPNGFKDYVNLVSKKYSDIDEKVKKGKKNGQ